MDIFIQNQLGFDVRVIIEEPKENELLVRVFEKPTRPRKPRGCLFYGLLAKEDAYILRDRDPETKVRFDLTAIKIRIRIPKSKDSDGDWLFQLQIQNGSHG